MSIAGEFLNGIGLWITRRERQQDRDDAALRSILNAVNATKLHLAARRAGDETDRESEARLVELWSEAAVGIRRSDPELAERLQEKAEFWADPGNWLDDDFRDNPIHIDKIATEAKRLLREG